MSKSSDFEKVKKVFRSCETKEQLDVAVRMGSFFCAKYAPDCIEELKRMSGLFSLMYCKLGLHNQEPIDE